MQTVYCQQIATFALVQKQREWPNNNKKAEQRVHLNFIPFLLLKNRFSGIV